MVPGLKRWQWMLLLFELVLFAIILILPQVDLPDFTAHNRSAPVAAHARVSSPPARTVSGIVAPVLVPPVKEEAAAGSGLRDISSPPSLDYRLSSLCTLIC
jgi:hypothetical protein